MREKARFKRLAAALALAVGLLALTVPAASAASAEADEFAPFLGVWECEGVIVTL